MSAGFVMCSVCGHLSTEHLDKTCSKNGCDCQQFAHPAQYSTVDLRGSDAAVFAAAVSQLPRAPKLSGNPGKPLTGWR